MNDTGCKETHLMFQ